MNAQDPSLPTLKLAVGIPAYGGLVTSHQARMWIAFGQALSMFSPRFDLIASITVDTNGVDRARNRLLAEAMFAGAEWLIMLDADTWVEAHNDNNPIAGGYALLRMVSDAAQAGVAVISAPVRIRDEGVGGDRIAAFIEKHGRLELVDPKAVLRGMQHVDSVGGACMAVDLHAVNKADAFFKFTDQLGEDHEFCRQMRNAGCRIALDGRIRTGHMSRSFPLYSE